jgi:hypothetical protein
MPVITPQYGSKVTLTMTLAALASDTALIAGRSSAAVDNKDTDFAVDAMVGGQVMTGTGPTAARQIEIWAYGSYDDTNFSGGATGADATLTPDDKSLMMLLCVIPTVNTANKAYRWGPYSIAQAFGGFVPVQWGIYVVHNTGVALNATGTNHEVEYTPVKLQSA